MIKALNEVRNSIAHRRTAEARAAKVAAVRLSGYGTEGFRKEVLGADDKEVIVLAAALASGFLAYLEDSVRKLRDVIAAALNVPKPAEVED